MRLLPLLFLVLAAFTGAVFWLTRGAPPATETQQSTASIGGAFTLTNHDGITVQDTDFRGKLMLVFFGFTNCPDICPVGLATITEALKVAGDAADGVTPLFITVDPERDTPDVMKTYLTQFDKRIIGLTGTAEQINTATKAYKAYAETTHHEHGAKDYQVNHSGYIYLMDRDGQYVAHFNGQTPPADIAAAIQKQVAP